LKEYLSNLEAYDQELKKMSQKKE